MHGSRKPTTATRDLSARAPFTLGDTRIDPAARTLAGRAGLAVTEPRVMRLLLMLVDARGGVVTRERLAETCWGGRFVADDTLNNAVAELRRVLRSATGERVSVETVPKTGYRLQAPAGSPLHPGAAGGSIDRRWLIGGAGVVMVAGLGGAFALWNGRVDRSAREAEAAVSRGLQQLDLGLPESGPAAAAAFRQAVALQDGSDARSLGLLALAHRASAEYAPPAAVAEARLLAERAAREALAIDPRQSDALTALALLSPSIGRWNDAEGALLDILRIDPRNRFAMAAHATLLMSTGQVRRCLARLDWLNDHHPLSPNLQFRRVYTLWSAGRTTEMDRVADNARQAWPRHPAVWFARLWTYAFTDRVPAALAMMRDVETRPAMPAPADALLALSLQALAGDDAAIRGRAVAANRAAAVRGPAQAISAILLLSQLGAADAALEVARGFLLGDGKVLVTQRHTDAQASITDQHHRMTMMLWIPATRPLRAEPGFAELCDGLGLPTYWRRAGVEPDEPISFS